MKNIIAAVLAATILSACGGGDGQSAPVDPPTKHIATVSSPTPVQLLAPFSDELQLLSGAEGPNMGSSMNGYSPWDFAPWEITEMFNTVTWGNEYGYVHRLQGQTGFEIYQQVPSGCNEQGSVLEHHLAPASQYRLSQMSGLTGSVSGVMYSPSFWQQSVPGCTDSVKFVQMLYAVILKADNGQVLFVQYSLSDSRGARPASSAKNWCPSYETGYAGQYCLDLAPQAVVAAGEPIQFNQPLLGGLYSVIQEGHVKINGESLDSDPAHWRVISAYVITALESAGAVRSRYFDVTLTATLK